MKRLIFLIKWLPFALVVLMVLHCLLLLLRNTLQLPCAQWSVTASLCCDACVIIQVRLLLFPPPCVALRPCRVVLLLAS